jgi:hypothetical protein
MILEPISKMSFGPTSLLVPRIKSSTYNSMPPVYDPQGILDQTANPAARESSAPPRSLTKILFLRRVLINDG